jgi:fatty-acid desaturase
MGWMFDEAAHDERCTTKSNASDLSKQPFYRHLSKWYPLHVSLKFLLMFLLFGFPGLVWGGAVSTVFLWHVTFFVNSACHLWGYQPFATGDQSRNNWWVGLLAFGEGWHNLHHGYAFSARHGIFKGELDVTWMIISLLQKLGLAKDVKLPTKKQIDRMLVKDFDRELAFTPS